MDGQLGAVRLIRGLRVLYCDGDRLYGARGLRLMVSEDQGVSWQPFGRVELPKLYELASRQRLAQRLTRTEIYKLHRVGSKLVAITKGGVYTGDMDEAILRPTYTVAKGSRPISLATGPEGELLFGEYHGNPHRIEMSIYRSLDGTRWDRVHTFSAGEIRHIHGIYFDQYEGCFWVLVGDEGHEPGIAKCSPDFSTVDFVRRGSQQVRAYSLIVRPEGLVYATDTESERNAIYMMSRDGRDLQELHELENSCFHCGEFADWMFFSTVCEPSERNDQLHLHIWGSKDGVRWKKVARYRKDRYPYLLQYGNVFFPEGQTRGLEDLIYSCTALEGYDDTTVVVPLSSL